MFAWTTEKPKTSINDAVHKGWGGCGSGVMGAPEQNNRERLEGDNGLNDTVDDGARRRLYLQDQPRCKWEHPPAQLMMQREWNHLRMN